jgi:hypothetical protein
MSALDELFERVRKYMRDVGDEGNLGFLLHRAELEVAALKQEESGRTAPNCESAPPCSCGQPSTRHEHYCEQCYEDMERDLTL